jgi:hypothetical protein
VKDGFSCRPEVSLLFRFDPATTHHTADDKEFWARVFAAAGIKEKVVAAAGDKRDSVSLALLAFAWCRRVTIMVWLWCSCAIAEDWRASRAEQGAISCLVA